jgi:CHAD domain-containing protein
LAAKVSVAPRAARRSALSGRAQVALPVRGDTIEEAARKALAVHARRLREHAPVARRGRDPEGVHRMRAAARQLRSDVRLFGAGLPPSAGRYLTRELRWLGRRLGTVRDVDVQLERLRTTHGSRARGLNHARAAFKAYLLRERAARRIELLAALDSARYRRLLLRLEHVVRTGPERAPGVNQPLVVIVSTALEGAASKLHRRGRVLEHHEQKLDAHRLHQLRIRARRLRYELEVLGDWTGKPGRRLVKRLVRVQDALGAHQDAVVAAKLLRRCLRRPCGEIGGATSVGLTRLIEEQAQAARLARADLFKRWRRFSSKGGRADIAEVLHRVRSEL